MNVDLHKNFPLEHDVDHAWRLLSNIEAVASCMPGAEIIEVIDENNFKGKVKVKLGPVNMAFNGDIKVKSINANEHQIQLIAEGQDNKGTSTASMDLTANIVAADVQSELVGDAKVIVNGKLASFGQRMMAQVSDQILNQFADNFRNKLAAMTPAQSTPASDTENASTGEPSDNNKSEQENPVLETAPAANNEINGFKFAFQTVIGLITGLFKSKKG